jgi:hypothetical protein
MSGTAASVPSNDAVCLLPPMDTPPPPSVGIPSAESVGISCFIEEELMAWCNGSRELSMACDFWKLFEFKFEPLHDHLQIRVTQKVVNARGNFGRQATFAPFCTCRNENTYVRTQSASWGAIRHATRVGRCQRYIRILIGTPGGDSHLGDSEVPRRW